ncbi:hypothetical protein ACEPAH_738 [Sanghuangporus vaninii]
MRSPGQRAKFDNPRYFDYQKDTKRWTCNACSPLSQSDGMAAQAALKHEKTSEHRENVRAREEWNSVPVDDNGWNTTTDDHIDQLRDFIPFWRSTIEAAEFGETLRFEDFMNALHKKEKEDVWNLPMPEWAIEPMGPVDADAEQRSTGKEHAQSSVSSHGHNRDAFNFVERIAKMDLADAERKKRLHSFYKMPTSEKLKRIYDLINTLRTAEHTH